MQDKEPLESITCAGCGHPILEGQPMIVVVAARHSQTNESSSRRASWRDRLCKAFLFYQDLEQLFGSMPRSIRDLCGKNGEAISRLAGGAATFLLLVGKKGLVVLRGVPPSGGLIAGGAVVAVVVVGGIAVGAIPAFNGRRRSREDKEPARYFHINGCPECGGGQSCYQDFTWV